MVLHTDQETTNKCHPHTITLCVPFKEATTTCARARCASSTSAFSSLVMPCQLFVRGLPGHPTCFWRFICCVCSPPNKNALMCSCFHVDGTFHTRTICTCTSVSFGDAHQTHQIWLATAEAESVNINTSVVADGQRLGAPLFLFTSRRRRRGRSTKGLVTDSGWICLRRSTGLGSEPHTFIPIRTDGACIRARTLLSSERHKTHTFCGGSHTRKNIATNRRKTYTTRLLKPSLTLTPYTTLQEHLYGS